MGYTNRYKKDGCTSHKDVDFGKIQTIALVTVPIMVKSSFQQKLAAAEKAKKSFDVTVDVDTAAGKARIVVKKAEPSDIVIEWTDRTGKKADAKKAVLKVKAALTSFAITNNQWVTEITKVKQKVGIIKDEIKVIEATAASGSGDAIALVKRIRTAEEGLKSACTEGQKLFRDHDTWYLNGPRKGVAPLLKAQNAEEKDLEKADAEELSKALHAMSVIAGQVKTIRDNDILLAAQALEARLKNIEARLTKSTQGALVEVRKNVAAEAVKIKELVGKAFAEIKAEKSQNLMDSLKDPNSAPYKRLASNPKFIATEVESNKVRLGIIPKYIEMVTKQCVRTMKGVPQEMIMDPQIVTLAKQLDELDKENKRNMASAKQVLENCNKALDLFAKSLK
jgi:hypothetical protein